MIIIDWEKKGNVVRFYYGDGKKKNYYGDDWDDRPYEHNAGKVYDEFISGYVDVAFPYDWLVLEPADDWHYKGNSPFCKDDFRKCKAPFLIVVPETIWNPNDGEYHYPDDEYSIWLGATNVYKFCFGDDIKVFSAIEEIITL